MPYSKENYDNIESSTIQLRPELLQTILFKAHLVSYQRNHQVKRSEEEVYKLYW
jgi:hypothetical protein